MVRRLLLAMLIIVLPIDSVWAAGDAHSTRAHPDGAVSAEKGSSATGETFDTGKHDGSSATLASADCSACHLAAAALTGATTVVGLAACAACPIALPLAPLTPTYIEPLERPKWLPLAA